MVDHFHSSKQKGMFFLQPSSCPLFFLFEYKKHKILLLVSFCEGRQHKVCINESKILIFIGTVKSLHCI